MISCYLRVWWSIETNIEPYDQYIRMYVLLLCFFVLIYQIRQIILEYGDNKESVKYKLSE